jgi:hypothetical protein
MRALDQVGDGDAVDYVLSFNAALRANCFTLGQGEFVSVPDSKVRERLFVFYDNDDDVLPHFEAWTDPLGQLGTFNFLGRWGPGPDPYSNKVTAIDLAWYEGWPATPEADQWRHSFIYDERRSGNFFRNFFRRLGRAYVGC